MFGAVLFETLAVVSIFVFRHRLPNADRPYRCPGYPFVPILYTIMPGFIVVNTLIQTDARVEAYTALGFVAISAVAYWALGLKNTAPRTPWPDLRTRRLATRSSGRRPASVSRANS